MTDKQQSRWRWAGRILIFMAGVAGILAAANQVPTAIKEWAALAVALLGFAARWCEQQLPAARGPAAPAAPAAGSGAGVAALLLLVFLLAIAVAACASPYAAAKRSTWSLMKATQTAGHGLATLARDADAKCSQQHPGGSEAYRTCTALWLKRLDAWRDYGRPAARSSVAGLYGAVRVSEVAKARPPDIAAGFKAGGCALLRGVREWGHMLPDRGAGVLKLLAGLDPAVCVARAHRSAVGAVVAGLNLALEIVAWLRRLLTDPADALFREVDAWLRAPPADGTDQVAAGIRKNLPKPRPTPRPRHAPARR